MLLISNVLIILDQFTKFLVVSNIPLYYSIRIVDGFFNLTHIRNPGVAFGLFAGHSSEYKSLFFVAVSSVAVVAILAFFHQTPDEKRMVQTGLTLIFSGAIGNMIDRLVHKEVIDFLDFFYGNFHWPAFNVADSCITIGMVLMIFDAFQKSPVHQAAPPCDKIDR